MKLLNVGGLLIGSLLTLCFLSGCRVGKHIISKEEAQRRYTNEHSSFVQIGDVNFHYRDEGDGPTILLIHGFGASLHTWEKIKPLLLQEGFRVISLDLPGFGLTDYPFGSDRSAECVLKEHLEGFIDYLGMDQLHLVGNSLGGWLAWELASERPRKVEKLILLNAAGYDLDDTNASAVKMGRKKIFNRIAKTGLSRFIIKRMVKQTFANKGKVTDELIEFYYGLSNREGNIAAAQYLARNWINPEVGKIKNIKAPTLIIWGEKDQLISVEDAKKFSRDLKLDEVIIYQNVGHTPMEEIPQICAEDMIRFLELK